MKRNIKPIKNLLIELEYLIRQECTKTNASEKGHCLFSYQINTNETETFIRSYADQKIPDDISIEELITGCYYCNHQKINIIQGLINVIQYLQDNHGLNVPNE